MQLHEAKLHVVELVGHMELVEENFFTLNPGRSFSFIVNGYKSYYDNLHTSIACKINWVLVELSVVRSPCLTIAL